MVPWDLARVAGEFQEVEPNALCQEFGDEGDQGHAGSARTARGGTRAGS